MPSIELVTTLNLADNGVDVDTTLLTKYASEAVAESGVGEPGVFGEGEADWTVDTTLTIDSTPATLALPGFYGVVQEAGFEVYVDGTLVKGIGPITVSRAQNESQQSFSFMIELDEPGVSALGDPFAKLGPPTGISEIDIYGVYRGDNGTVYRYPLILGGIVDNSARECAIGKPGYREVHNGLDKGARFARQLITQILPAGHGLRRNRIVAKFLEAAGETDTGSLQGGERAFKEIQFVDADPVQAAQEIIDVENRRLRWNRRGKPIMPKLKPDSYSSAMDITEADILRISIVKIDAPADAVTEVTATGTEQVTDEEETCGFTPHETTVEAYSNFAPAEAYYSQGSGCALTALTVNAIADHQLNSLVITRTVTYCDTVIFEEVLEYGYFNPKTARYSWNAPGDGTDNGTWDCIGSIPASGVYLYSDATVNGNEDAYAYRVEKWFPIRHTTVVHCFDSPGFSPLSPGSRFEHMPVTMLGSTPPGYTGYDNGRYLGYYRITRGWYAPEEATLFRYANPASSAWEYWHRDGVHRFGSGMGVWDGSLPDAFEVPGLSTFGAYVPGLNRGPSRGERFTVTEAEIKFIKSTEDGYVSGETTNIYGWAIHPLGNDYQFADGQLSDVDHEELILRYTNQTTYRQVSETTMSTTVTTKELGRSARQTITTEEGSLPGATYLPGYEPVVPTTVDGEEDLAEAVDARSGVSQLIKIVVEADDLLVSHLQRPIKVNFPYAESLDELANIAVALIEESLTFEISLTLAANFLLEEGSIVRLTYRPGGIEARYCVVDEITWTHDGEKTSPVLTNMILRLYPDG